MPNNQNNPLEDLGGVLVEEDQDQAVAVVNNPLSDLGGVPADDVFIPGQRLVKDPDYVSLPNYVKYKVGVDTAQKAYSLFGASAMTGHMSDEEALRRGKEERDHHLAMAGPYKDLSFAEHPFKMVVGEAAQQIPYMLSSTFEGLKYGFPMAVGFGSIAAVAGQAGPQVAFPEEIVTIPGAFLGGLQTGFAYGVVKNIMEREGGSMYLDMIDKGIDSKTARPISMVAGALTGIIEIGEMILVGGGITKPLTDPIRRKITQSITSNLGRGLIMNFMKKYAKTIGMELAEEEIQNALQLGGESLAAFIDQKPDAKPDLAEWKAQLLDAAPRMAAGLALLSIPGAAVEATSEVKEARAAERQTRLAAAKDLMAFEERLLKEIDKGKQADMAEEFIGNVKKTFPEGEETVRQILDKIIKKPENQTTQQFSQEIKSNITPESIKPDISGITSLRKQIDQMEERQEKVGLAKESLSEVDAIRQYFKGRIRKYEGEYLAEELQGFPAYYITKEGGMKPDEVMDELRRNFNIEVNDEVGLKEFFQNLDKSKKDLLYEIQVNRPELVTKRETTLLNQKIKAVEQGIREGKLQAREEIQTVQEEIIEALEMAHLPAEERAKFLRTIKNTQTKADLVREFPTIAERIRSAKETQVRREIIGEIKKAGERAKSTSSISVEYADLINAIINEFEFQGHREDTIASLKRTREYIKAAAKRGENVEMPQEVLDRMQILNRKPVKELSIEELEGLQETVENLEQQGGTLLRMRKLADERKKLNALKELLADTKPLVKRDLKKAPVRESLGALDEVKNTYAEGLNKYQGLNLALTTPDRFFDFLDDFKNYKGANYRIFKKTIDSAYSDYLTLREKIEGEVQDLAKKLKLKEGNYEAIGVYAALQQDGGRDKLLNTGFSEQEIDNLTLTAEEQQLYDLMREKLDILRAPIAEVMRLVYNEPFYEVKNYFPFMTDFEKMTDSEIRARFGDNVEQYGLAPRKNVERGMTRKRVGGRQKIKVHAMAVFQQHVDNASYLVTVGKETKWLGELAASEQYAEAAGQLGQEQVREWIDLMARKGKLAGQRMNWQNTLRKITGASVLAYRVTTMMAQFSSLAHGASFLGHNVFNGLWHVATSGEWRKFVMANMPEVKARIGDDAAFAEFDLSRGPVNWFVSKAGKVGFVPLQTFDRWTASFVAAGAYEKYCNENGINVDLSKPNKEALDYAQKTVRLTQASPFFKDMPPVLRKDFGKFWFQFQTFTTNEWNLVQHDMWRAGILQKDFGKAATILFVLTLGRLVETGSKEVGGKLLHRVFAQILGLPEEDDDDDEKFAQKAIGNMVVFPPFMNSLMYSLKFGSNPIPGWELVNKVMDRISWASQAKDPEKKLRHLLRAIVLPLPGGSQVEQLGKNKKETGKWR